MGGKKKLRSGFTTGACAAAAAKGAALALLEEGKLPTTVELLFPDGNTHSFALHHCQRLSPIAAEASVIKDAGDDPDVTNGAEICARVELVDEWPKDPPENCTPFQDILLCGGEGVGRVTKPGLAVNVGEPAINPVPRQMISQGVRQVLPSQLLGVTISVPQGQFLAEKTLNHRLGIIGGLSILGTTGIVKPVSADAWKATIQASMDVAREAGLQEIVISTGRTSEKGAQSLLALPEEAYAMMGDYLAFSLQEAAVRGFSRIHLAGMWAKIMKAALAIPQTHVRHGALEVENGLNLLRECGADPDLLADLQGANTAREILLALQDRQRQDLIEAVCIKAKDYAEEMTGRQVAVYLIDHRAEVIARV